MRRVEIDYNSVKLEWAIYILDFRGPAGDRYLGRIRPDGGLEWVECPKGSGLLAPTLCIPTDLMHGLAGELERHQLLDATHRAELRATKEHLADMRRLTDAILEMSKSQQPDG